MLNDFEAETLKSCLCCQCTFQNQQISATPLVHIPSNHSVKLWKEGWGVILLYAVQFELLIPFLSSKVHQTALTSNRRASADAISPKQTCFCAHFHIFEWVFSRSRLDVCQFHPLLLTLHIRPIVARDIRFEGLCQCRLREHLGESSSTPPVGDVITFRRNSIRDISPFHIRGTLLLA